MERTEQQTPSKTFDIQAQPQNQSLIQDLQSDLSQFSTVFSKADARAVAAFFTPDATLINPAGERAQGRDAIFQVAQNDMNTFLKGSRNEFKLEKVRVLSDDLVLADINQYVTGMKTPEGRDAPSMTLHLVCLCKKMGDRWMWLDARPYSFVQMPAASVH